MLCSIETEAVNAVVSQRVEQVVNDIVLISLRAGVHVGELTAEVVGNLSSTIVVAGGIVVI